MPAETKPNRTGKIIAIVALTVTLGAAVVLILAFSGVFNEKNKTLASSSGIPIKTSPFTFSPFDGRS